MIRRTFFVAMTILFLAAIVAGGTDRPAAGVAALFTFWVVLVVVFW